MPNFTQAVDEKQRSTIAFSFTNTKNVKRLHQVRLAQIAYQMHYFGEAEGDRILMANLQNLTDLSEYISGVLRYWL